MPQKSEHTFIESPNPRPKQAGQGIFNRSVFKLREDHLPAARSGDERVHGRDGDWHELRATAPRGTGLLGFLRTPRFGGNLIVGKNAPRPSTWARTSRTRCAEPKHLKEINLIEINLIEINLKERNLKERNLKERNLKEI
jgi:hypothetical protein